MPIATLLRAPERRAQQATRRIEALDALRGLAIALMIFVNNPGDHDAMPRQLVHADWHGFRVAELVFPLFLLSAGISMALSRRAGAAGPMLRRVALLVVIGGVLVSVKYRHPAPSTGTLQLIAGASLLAWAARRWLSRRAQAVAAAAVLGGLWIGFTVTGWAPQSNLAAVVDAHLLGAPSDLGLLGIVSASVIVLAGGWVGDLLLRAPTAMARAVVAARAGVAATAAGLALAMVVPVNKRIWTPSYVVLGTGLSCLVLAAFLWWCGRRLGNDAVGPLQTLGANAIAVYVATSLAATTVLEPVRVPVFGALAGVVTPAGAAVAWASGMLLAGYGLCAVLQRRRIFIRL
jgi:predicted acyltransferase